MERMTPEWWMKFVEDCVGYDFEEVEEGIQWLLKGWAIDPSEDMWPFAGVISDALLESLPFKVLLDIEPYIGEKGTLYLIVTAVHKDTLICLTADPNTASVPISYPLPYYGFESLDELNRFFNEIVTDLTKAYEERVASRS